MKLRGRRSGRCDGFGEHWFVYVDKSSKTYTGLGFLKGQLVGNQV